MNNLKKSIVLIGVVAFLSACGHTPRLPEWTSEKPSKGTICQGPKGIYPLAKAKNLVINQCLVQLADKVIVGESNVKQKIQVDSHNNSENVSSSSTSVDTFKVKVSDGSSNIKYDLKNSLYDRATDTIYVWVVLK